MVLNGIVKYHWEYHVSLIYCWTVFKYHWEYHWNKIVLLNGPMVLNGIFKYDREYHWNLIYYWNVCSNIIGSTIEA